MKTDVEQIARAHADMMSQALAQPGVADMLKAYRLQSGFLSTFSVVSQANVVVAQVRAAQDQHNR